MDEDDVDFDGMPRQSIPMEGCKAVDMCDDSMDIYEDLANPSSPLPLEQGEGGVEFDLLEELLVEETSGKIRTIEELSRKFEESQKHIAMLTKNMKMVQEQNTTLLTQNEQLKKNMCALFKTAKAEINRKSEEIQRLNSRHSLTPQTDVPRSCRRRNPRHEMPQHESASTRTSSSASFSRHNGQQRRRSPESAEAVKSDSSQPDRKRVDSTTRHRVSASEKTSPLDSSAKTPSDQLERLRVDQSKSRLDQSARPHSDRTPSRLDHADKSRKDRSDKARVDRSDNSRVDRSDNSRVDRSDNSRVDRSDNSRVDRSDNSRVDRHDKSRVDRSDNSRVDRSDNSRVDRHDTSCVDRSDKSRMDRSDNSRVDHHDKSRVDHSKSRMDHSEKSRADQTDHSCVDESRSGVDHSKLHIEQCKSRLGYSDKSRVDCSDKSRIDCSDKSRVDCSNKSRVDCSDKLRIDCADKSRVDCSDKSRIECHDKSPIDCSDKSRVDCSDKSRIDCSNKSRVECHDKSRVDCHDKSRVDCHDKSRVDCHDKSRVDCSDKSREDCHDKSRVECHDKSRVDCHDKSRVDNSDKSRVDCSDKSRVDCSDKSRVVCSNKSRVDNSDKSRVDCSDKSRVDCSDKSHVDCSNKSRVDSHDKSRVECHDMSRVECHDKSRVDCSDKSRVDCSDKSRVDCSDKSRVDCSDKSRVDCSDKSRVDCSDKSRVDRSDKSRVDRSDKSRVDNSDKSRVDNSDKSRVDSHDKSRVDCSDKSRVDCSDKSRVDSHDKSRVDCSNKSRVDCSDKSRVDCSDKSRVDSSDKSRVDNFDKLFVDNSVKSRPHHSENSREYRSENLHVDQSETSHVDQYKLCVGQSDMVNSDCSELSINPFQRTSSDKLDKPFVDNANSCFEQSDGSCLDNFKMQSVQPEQLHIKQSAKTSSYQSNNYSDPSSKSVLEEPMSCSDRSSKFQSDQFSILNLTQSAKPNSYLPDTHSDDASKAQLHQSEGPFFNNLKKLCSHHSKQHIDQAAKFHPDQSAMPCLDKAVDTISEKLIQLNSMKSPSSEAMHHPDKHVESVANSHDKDAPIATLLSTPQGPPTDHQLITFQPEVANRMELKDKSEEMMRPEQVSRVQTQKTNGSTRKKLGNKAVPVDGITEDSTDSMRDLCTCLQVLSLDRLREIDDENHCCPSKVGTSEQADKKRSVNRGGQSAGTWKCLQIAPSRHSSQLAMIDHDHRTKECEHLHDAITEEGHNGRVQQLKSIPTKCGFADTATTVHTDRTPVDYPKHCPHRNNDDSEERCHSSKGSKRRDGGRKARPVDNLADDSEERCHSSKGSKRRDGGRKARPVDNLAGRTLVSEVRCRRDGSAEKCNARHKTKLDQRKNAEGRDDKSGRGDSAKNREVTSCVSREKIPIHKERTREKLKHNGGSAVRTPGKMQIRNHSVHAKSPPNAKCQVWKCNSTQDVVGIEDPCNGTLTDEFPSIAEAPVQRQRWTFASEQLSFSALSEFTQQSGGNFSWCLTPKVATELPHAPPARVVESSSIAEESNLDSSVIHQPDSMEEMIVLDEFILDASPDANRKVDGSHGSDGDGPTEGVELLNAHSNTSLDEHGGSVEHSDMSAEQDDKDNSALVQQELSKSPTEGIALATCQSSQSTEHHLQLNDERNVSAVTSPESEAAPETLEVAQTPIKRGGSMEAVSMLKQSKVTFMSSLSLTLSPQRGICAKNKASGGAPVSPSMAVVAAPFARVASSSSKSGCPVSIVKLAEDASAQGKCGTDPATDDGADAIKKVLSGHAQEESRHANDIPQQNSGSVEDPTSDKMAEAEDNGPEEGEIVSDTEPEDVLQDTFTQDVNGSGSGIDCAAASTTAASTITTVSTVMVPLRHSGEATSCYSGVSRKCGNKFPANVARLKGYASQKHGHRFPNRSCRQEFNLRKRSYLIKNPLTALAKQTANRNKPLCVKPRDWDCPANKNQQPEQTLTMHSILRELENIKQLVRNTYSSSSVHAQEPTMHVILDYAEKQSLDTLNKFNWSGQDDSKMELCSLIRKSIGQLKNYPNIESLFSGKNPNDTSGLLNLLDKEFDILFSNIRYTLCLQQLGNKPHNSTTVVTRRRPAGIRQESKNKKVKSIPWEQHETMSSREKYEKTTVSPKNAVGGKALNTPLRSALSPLATMGVSANFNMVKIPKLNGALRSPVERRDPACVKHIVESMAHVHNSTLQSLKLGARSIIKPQSQLKRKKSLEVEVITGAPVKEANSVGKRRKMDPEENVRRTADADNCDRATETKIEMMSSGGESANGNSSSKGNGGSDGDDIIVHGDFAPESFSEDVETTSLEMDECPVTPGKSMFGPDIDKGTEHLDGSEVLPIEEFQADHKSPTVEISQNPLPLPPLSFTFCAESNMGEELLSLLGKKQQILQELSRVKSPEVTNPDLRCSENLSEYDSVDMNYDKSSRLNNPNSPNSTHEQKTNWFPPISSILLMDLEVSNSLLSPLKDSYKSDGCALITEKTPLPSDGPKIVPLPVACFSENAQFDEDESDFHLALDTESPSEDDDSSQIFLPLKNKASKKESVESVAPEDPQRLHLKSEGSSKKRQLPSEEECDSQKPKAKGESSTTPEPDRCKLRRHSKSFVSAQQDGEKNKLKKLSAHKTTILKSPESEQEESLVPAPKTKHRKKKSVEKNESSMSPCTEEQTQAKGHRRTSKTTTSKRQRGTKASVNAFELGAARCSSGEKPPHKTKKHSRYGASPDKVILAKNVVKKDGEVMLLWTRDNDRLILSEVQRHGATAQTFSAIAVLLGDKTSSQVSRRFRELLRLFHKTAAESVSDDEASGSDGDSDATLQLDCESSGASPAADASSC